MSILSNIFMPYGKDRDDIDQSTRKIMLVLLREIVNNRIQIEALLETIKAETFDSSGDIHDHMKAYMENLPIAEAKWAGDLADINQKLNQEEAYNEKWTRAYKDKLNSTPHYCTNKLAQMNTDATKIKQYDYVDQEPYVPAKPPTTANTNNTNNPNRSSGTKSYTKNNTTKGNKTR